MPVSGLVVTFGGSPAEQQDALEAIRKHGSFTLGEVTEKWLPLAMEARDDAESRELHDWLMSLDGITFVDVVAVNFDSDLSQGKCGKEPTEFPRN